MATLFQELTAAGCEIGSHESDLHVKDSPISRSIIQRHEVPATQFRSTIDNMLWWEVCFHYDPFWQKNGVR